MARKSFVITSNRDLMTSGAAGASTGLAGSLRARDFCMPYRHLPRSFAVVAGCSWLLPRCLSRCPLTEKREFPRRWPACWLFFFGIISGNSQACRRALARGYRKLLQRELAGDEGRRQRRSPQAPHAWASPMTRMRPRARLRGFVLTVISTSWPSAVSRRISRSLEKFVIRPLRSADTFG